MNREDELTSWFAKQSGRVWNHVQIGIGDDMAKLGLSGSDSVLITTDMLLDGVHFDLAHHHLDRVGHKAVAASLSDCAAMATVPVGAVVSVALPKGFEREKIEQLYRGMLETAEEYDCPLVGGDITVWPREEKKLCVNVTMLSRESGHHPAVPRFGAVPGDTIFVTGKLGGSLAGRHLTFTPRVNEALVITNMARIHSMIDITDGLAIDLSRICRQSKVGALIEAGEIPISDAALDSDNPLNAALNDGEDFELLFTASPANAEKLMTTWNLPTKITRIGTITNPGARMEAISGAAGTNAEIGKVQLFKDGEIMDLDPAGYDHLK